MGQEGRGDALTVVSNGEGGEVILRFFRPEMDGGGGFAVDDSVFNQVGVTLLILLTRFLTINLIRFPVIPLEEAAW